MSSVVQNFKKIHKYQGIESISVHVLFQNSVNLHRHRCRDRREEISERFDPQGLHLTQYFA